MKNKLNKKTEERTLLQKAVYLPLAQIHAIQIGGQEKLSVQEAISIKTDFICFLSTNPVILEQNILTVLQQFLQNQKNDNK